MNIKNMLYASGLSVVTMLYGCNNETETRTCTLNLKISDREELSIIDEDCDEIADEIDLKYDGKSLEKAERAERLASLLREGKLVKPENKAKREYLKELDDLLNQYQKTTKELKK